jgi:hypothetical protein
MPINLGSTEFASLAELLRCPTPFLCSVELSKEARYFTIDTRAKQWRWISATLIA